jgi:large subunit ribosomal protein L24e
MLQTKNQKCIHFNKKPYSRFTLEVMQKRRIEKPKVCDAARKVALREVRRFFMPFLLMVVFFLFYEIKEEIKKTKDENKAKKTELIAKTWKTQSKGGPKGVAPKDPKLGGGGGGLLVCFFIFEVDKALKSFLSNDRFC